MPIKSKKLLLVCVGLRTSVTDVSALRAGELLLQKGSELFHGAFNSVHQEFISFV